MALPDYNYLYDHACERKGGEKALKTLLPKTKSTAQLKKSDQIVTSLNLRARSFSRALCGAWSIKNGHSSKKCSGSSTWSAY